MGVRWKWTEWAWFFGGSVRVILLLVCLLEVAHVLHNGNLPNNKTVTLPHICCHIAWERLAQYECMLYAQDYAQHIGSYICSACGFVCVGDTTHVVCRWPVHSRMTGAQASRIPKPNQTHWAWLCVRARSNVTRNNNGQK